MRIKIKMDHMDGEFNNFIMVWTIAASTMCYCHTIGKFIPQGKTRILAVFPAILILLLLPLRLTSVHLGGPTSFILGWLSTFKLLLFALGKGPLSSKPPLSLSYFIFVSLLPIKLFQQHQPSPSNTQNNRDSQGISLKPNRVREKADECNLTHIPREDVSRNTQNSQITKNGHKSSPVNYSFAIIVIVLTLLIPIYAKNEILHPKFKLFLYSLHMYIGLEFILASISLLVRKLLGIKLEPQFNKPYLCTSLQDFWGKRWNLMVNQILHPTIYEPVVNVSTRVIGRKWAPLPAIISTFAVSGLMHELVFYYVKREKRTFEAWEPSWDSMCFFLLHGVCLAIEVSVKKVLKGKWKLPRLVSWPLTVVFVIYTALLLFLPALVRSHVFEKEIKELNAIVEFGMDLYGNYFLKK
ncbi:hypothetical protein TanjilG_17831 [Lupinus angustifolius]|uniref:Wax synthase domain-containing protein n=1 Tax=Lupinus angustifolius TaxID=3871 RepID=A0A4P1QPX4_LUPAN|nr:PREDICTED: acyl-CoA--sterol O-acyltransferase 1-like [Lupinus angustifolius]OIV91839.1 hypothetical protein TanjilG_17831 [Lupinus angustifolius]